MVEQQAYWLAEQRSRNYLYLDHQQQKRLASLKVIFAGCGLNSVAAIGCARLGVERFTLIDFDRVELSNLNRQAYFASDVGEFKCDQLRRHILAVNPYAEVVAIREALTSSNIANLVSDADVMVNTVDFEDGQYLAINSYAQDHLPLTLFPLNLGFAAAVYAFGNQSQRLDSLIENDETPQSILVSHVIEQMKTRYPRARTYLKDVLRRYSEREQAYDPQLTTGAHLAAALVQDLLVAHISAKQIAYFPQVSFLSTENAL